MEYFFLGVLCNCSSYFTTAKVTCIPYAQCIYMIYIIYKSLIVLPPKLDYFNVFSSFAKSRITTSPEFTHLEGQEMQK